MGDLITFENVRVGEMPASLARRLGRMVDAGEIRGDTGYVRRYECYVDLVEPNAVIECLWHTHDGIDNDRSGITDLIVDRVMSGRYIGFALPVHLEDDESAPRSEAAATLGRISTPAKAAAARANGRKGGRPRKTK